MSSNNRQKSSDIGKPSLENVNKPLENANILSIENRKTSSENGKKSSDNGTTSTDNGMPSLENGNTISKEKRNTSSKKVDSSSGTKTSSSGTETPSAGSETSSSDSEKSPPDSKKSSLYNKNSSSGRGSSSPDNVKSAPDSEKLTPDNVKSTTDSVKSSLGISNSSLGKGSLSPDKVKSSLENVKSTTDNVKSTPDSVKSYLSIKNSSLGRGSSPSVKENSTSDNTLSSSESGNSSDNRLSLSESGDSSSDKENSSTESINPSSERTITPPENETMCSESGNPLSRRRITPTENETMCSESSSSYAAGDIYILQEKHNLLHAEYEKEKLARIEANKAFQNVIVLYHDERKNLMSVLEGYKQVSEMVAKTKEKYSALKQETDEKEKDLTDANEMIRHLKRILAEEKEKTKQAKEKKLTDPNDMIGRLKRILAEEKQKTKQAEAELEKLMEPMSMDEYNNTSEQREEELMNEHYGLERLTDFKIKLKEAKNEREELKNEIRVMESKMLDLTNYKNQLTMHSKSCQSQLEAIQEVLETKDTLIDDLMSRNPMDDPTVQNRIKMYERHRNFWQNRAVTLNKEIESNKITFEKDMRQADEKRRAEIQNACRIHEILKRNYKVLSQKLNTETSRKDEEVLALIEAANVLKTEINEQRDKYDEHDDREITSLEEEVRIKDLEISMLTEVKTRYEEKIQKQQCGGDLFGSAIEAFEEKLRSEEQKVRESETLNYALRRLRNEANQSFQQEKQTRLIQEKMLEDNRQTLCRLKSQVDSLENMVRRRR